MQQRSSSPRQPPIAIVGIGGLFPGSTDVARFWANVLAGTDLITDIPATHWSAEHYFDPDPKTPDKTYCKRGGFLPEVDFDSLAYGIPPSLLSSTDTSQLLALLVARTALEDAFDGRFDAADKSRVSVLLGVTSGQELFGQMAARLAHPMWRAGMRAAGVQDELVDEAVKKISETFVPWTESTFPGLLGNVVAGRIANRLDTGGTNAVTDAACASSFAAISMGIDELVLGRADVVLTGGVDTLNDIFMYMCFSKTPALSASGECRPFDEHADGTLLGEGLGMVALKRLDDAERDGNHIYAVIKGVGTSSDGRHSSVYAPVPEGQAKALRRAYVAAGYGPGSVELVEGHGTGTKAGDLAELSGLKLAFGEGERDDKQWCALGSVKSQIGHTKAAAGAAGLLKAALSLHHKVLPPTLKVERPNPKAQLDESPFYVNSRARPWVRSSAHPRRASVSSFGFGGSNFHITLEEYTGAATAPRLLTRDAELFCVSAPDDEGLKKRLGAMKQRAGEEPLWSLARASQEAFDAGAAERVAFVAASPAELGKRLDDALAAVTSGSKRMPGVHFGSGAPEGKLAYLFPGQGSQVLEMGGALARAFPEALAAFDEADDVSLGEVPLSRVVFPPPAFDDDTARAQSERLTQTQWAQPALGAASVAVLRVLEQLGLAPDVVAGHSFGELVALHAAGAFDYPTLLRLARRRGELMAASSQAPGGMAAVSGPVAQVRALLEASGEDQVVLANHNAPDQCVLSGELAALGRVSQQVEAAGLKVRPLSVATGFHSPLVAPAAEGLASFLEEMELAPARVPVFANSTAEAYPDDDGARRRVLAEQVRLPVRFVEEIEALYAAGVRTFLEVGPGRVLAGLVGRVLQDRPHAAIATDSPDGVAGLFDALARLLALGVPVRTAALWQGVSPLAPGQVETSGEKKPSLVVKMNGSNAGKPPFPAPKPPAPRRAVPSPAAAPAPERPMAVKTPPFDVPANVTPSGAPAAAPTDGWLAVFREGQRQTAEAHAAFQRSMGDAHLAFLRAFEASSSQLSQLASGTPVPTSVAPLPVQAVPSPLPAPLPVPVPSPSPSPQVAAPQPQPPPPRPSPSPSEDISALLLEVVADKTGYPKEALAPGMSLEADLGIDSIKRVEIMGALRGRAPALPEVDAMQLAQLSTLGEIAAALGAVAAAPATTAEPGTGLQALLLEVVADKTGYPQDALTPSMSLEADLGIDSIKRVEILGALRERSPGLPEVDAMQLAQLSTLGEIAAALGAASPAPSAAKPASDDVAAVFLAVVAEKTGYPKDALALDMSLEADLGIDSIKRVEILGGVRERCPTLPEVDAMQLAQLSTLGEVVAALGGGSTPPAPTPGADVAAVFLAVVAEKTGYPQDALSLGMSLEADLGIDSIKRVEILGGVRERSPGLPEVDAMHLAQLSTLGEVVAALGGAGAAKDTGEQPPAAKQAPVQRAEVALAPVTSTRAPLALPAGARVVVTGSDKELRAAVSVELASRGLAPVPLTTEGIESAAGLLDLGGLASVTGDEDALAVLRASFDAARSAARALQAAPGGAFYCVVQDTDGELGLSGRAGGRALLGGLAALAKTAAQEWPGVRVKALELRRGERTPAEVAALVVEEALGGADAVEVALHGDARLTLVTRAAPLPEGATPDLGDRAVIVATGGARGVTATSLEALLERGPARLVLLGRTDVERELSLPEASLRDEGALKRALFEAARARGEQPSLADVGAQAARVLSAQEVAAQLDRFRAKGAEVLYVPVDVRDASALEHALGRARDAFGPITGIVHGAGVLADKRLEDKSLEQFDRVVDTKLRGLLSLLRATTSDPVRFIALFSSVAGRFGNVGQADYAMANEAMSKLAQVEQHRRGPSCLVKSYAWGPWEGGMVTPGLRKLFEERGVSLLPLAEGARFFAEELSGAARGRGVEAVFGGPLTGEPVRDDEAHDATHIDSRGFAFLKDHALRGTPVLPVVMAVELVAQAARRRHPGLVVRRLHSLRVLRGVPLKGFYNGGNELKVALYPQQPNGSGAEVSLRAEVFADGDPVARYTAVVELGATCELAGAAPVAPAGLEAFPVDRAVIYRDLLFHGPSFQLVEEVEGISAEGIVGRVRGTRQAGWGERPFDVDVGALDAGLQLALLYGRHAQGGAFLPTSFERFIPYAATLPEGELRCVVNARPQGNDRVRADVSFLEESGRLLMQVRGLELHRLLDDNAFQQGQARAAVPAAS